MLLRRGKLYYCRLFVPLELREIIGRAEFKKSLRTSDRKEAKAAAAALVHKAETAEHEVKAISARTKVALAEAKKRGVKLGNPNLTMEGRIKGNEAGIKTIKEAADAFAGRVADTIKAYQAQGLSLRGIARELDKIGVKTARGKSWTPTAVKNVIARV